MKKLLSFILAFALLFSISAVNTVAEDYSSEDIKMIREEFNTLKKSIDALFCKDNTILYWNYANEQEQKKFLSTVIIHSSYLLDTPPNEDFYIEQLTTLIALYEADAIKGVEKQSEFDNVKSGGDIALDILDIAAGALGGKIKNDTVKNAVSAVKNSQSFVIDTYEEIKCYEAAIKAYNNSTLLLDAIINNASNNKLKNAASTLKSSNDEMFRLRMKAASNITKEVSKYSASFIMDDVYGKAVDLAKKSGDKALIKFANSTAKAISNLAANINIGNTIFAVSIAAGDVLFGTSNCFSRYNEMRILADIAEAIIKQNNKIKVPSGNDEETIAAIKTKIEYYKLLLTTHSRGEYALYSLTHNEAGVLSDVTKYLNKKEYEKDSEDWYKEQKACIEEYYEKLNSIFARGKQFDFELHNGFIVPVNQKDEVPEGYIGIYSFDDFYNIALNCPDRLTSMDNGLNEINSAKYILMNDIVCPSDYETATIFGGILDGNGYTIHNVGKPLFGELLNAVVINLGLEVSYANDYETDIDNEMRYGALAKRVSFDYESKKGEAYVFDDESAINNCFVKGNLTISGKISYVGGLLGEVHASDLIIKNCYNSAKIKSETRMSANVGGIVGYQSLSGVTIENCFNEGDITAHSLVYHVWDPDTVDVSAGGIAGNGDMILKGCLNVGEIRSYSDRGCRVFAGGIYGGSSTAVSESYAEYCCNKGGVFASRNYILDEDTKEKEECNSGLLYAYGLHAGGIFGGSREGEVVKCWNEGNITGDEISGGIIGLAVESEISESYNTGEISSDTYSGGLVGWSDLNGKIKNSYSCGNVSGTKSGALAGTATNADDLFENCYYTIGDSPTMSGAKLSGTKKVTRRNDRNSFKGFDFKSTWTLFGTENGYPRLK